MVGGDDRCRFERCSEAGGPLETDGVEESAGVVPGTGEVKSNKNTPTYVRVWNSDFEKLPSPTNP